MEKKAFDHRNVKKHIDQFKMLYDNFFKIKCYPRFSANLADINRDLDILERIDGFVPDVIVIDYADILKPERATLKGTEKEDETWMALARLASTRHTLTITGTQLTRKGIDSRQVKQSDTSLWIGKLAHVDCMLALNQTDTEKKMNVMRVSKMAHRYEDFNQSDNCFLLQQLAIGQAALDSEISRSE